MINIEDAEQSTQDSPENLAKNWRAKFESGILATDEILSFFQRQAPKFIEIATVQEAVRCTYNEAEAKSAIIDVLVEFMLGENPQDVLEEIRTEGNTTSFCGKVFKNGEATYSCRECGADNTCVLCVNCFKQSAHRFHKYRMATSSGGGCCDCGDVEAWKNYQYCDEHAKGREHSKESKIITSRMRERLEIAFRAIIMYSVKFLEIESYASLECLDHNDSGDDSDEEGQFCTVLYNDEGHTFEQVINTLTKIIKCQQKDAMEIVTAIDRDGRAVAKCGTFEQCTTMKEHFEKQPMQYTLNISKLLPLKVSVLHKRAVSCQQFALQLLTWFQDFLTRHLAFREVFALVAGDKTARDYNIAHILECDWKLWKNARSCWHRLLISGLLMEYDNKKMLAVQFSRHYATIIQDYIRDDHDYSFSVVSLSVQLFTVPTIAHYLIANEGIFHKLMHTFYYESIEKYVQNNVLRFTKNLHNLNICKRASCILSDIRYILGFKPDVWTDELREGFLEGCKVLVKLLGVMQGMEAVIRQTGHHMDYEPEWESAFNLHIKLACTISLILDWCATDREVLVKLYGMVAKKTVEKNIFLKEINISEKKLAGHASRCNVYDVALQPVSVHLPVSRIFSGLYVLLGKYGLCYDNAPFTSTLNISRLSEEIIEPILCTQTMIAQVQAGMWRRNGYSLLHQLFFYRNVRCRAEMLDRDISGLQIAASLVESNQFLIQVINKFGLIKWAQPEYEPVARNPTDDDFIRILSMIDELLELFIVIIGERYMPGIGEVTDEERLRNEIIHLLCIKEYSHSELTRALPENDNEIATTMEEIIAAVATFKKPSHTDSRGVYALKDEYYDQYNIFFYHYTKEDKSRSEEAQITRRKAKGELACCPPPKLPKLSYSFVSIANILQCDVMLHLMQIILSRGLDLKAHSFQESHLQKILHLIGYGLQEEQSQNYPFLSFYERAQKYELLPLLEKLSHSARVESHRDLIIWTIRKFKELQPKPEKGTDGLEKIDDAATEESSEPLTNAETEAKEKADRAKVAAERRAKILAEMANAQSNFMKSNAEMFCKASTSNDAMEWEEQYEESSVPLATADDDAIEAVEMTSKELEADDEDDEGAAAYQSSACLGFKRRFQQPEELKFKCILCFEDAILSRDGDSLVYSAFIQKAKVIYPLPDKKLNLSEDELQPPSPHTSTCGHVMHALCWKEYFDNEVLKEHRRLNRTRPPKNLVGEKREFLCPYCRCFSNAVLPLSAPLSQYSAPIMVHKKSDVMPFDRWISVMHRFLNELYILEQQNVSSTATPASAVPNMEKILQECGVSESEFHKICQPINKNDIALPGQSWSQLVQSFLESIQRVAPYLHSNEDCEYYLVAWDSCAYTIGAIEMYLRATDKPFSNDDMSIRHSSCLSGLIRVCSLLGSLVSQYVASKLQIHLRGVLETVLKQKGPSVLEWNCFSMLSSLVFMFPALMYSCQDGHVVPTGNFLEFYLLKLVFLANIVKAIVLFENDDGVDEMENDDNMELDIKNFEIIAQFYAKYNLSYRSGTNKLVSPKTIQKLLNFVKKSSTHFLRCSCLLFHFITDVDFPPEMETIEGGENFEVLCSYLGLNPLVEEYFDDSNGTYMSTLEHFGSHSDILYYDPVSKTKPDGKPFEIVSSLLEMRSLIKLPQDYSDLINSVSEITCPNNDREEMKTPTMCLVCGEIVCGQSYCCQPDLNKTTVGACTYHAHFCGSGISVFLRIRDCQILCLGDNKGCFIQAPYLDEYGETDQGLRRGNPLRLCAERYRKLNLTWLGHGLHEEIARLGENPNSVIATQWHHI